MAFRKHPYGASVVGKEEAELQRQVKKKKSNIYGRSVVDDRPQDAPHLTGGPVSAEKASMNLDELGKLLKDEPARLDVQIDAEFARADGPRKGALRLFLELEQKRDGGPRAEVMALIEQSLR